MKHLITWLASILLGLILVLMGISSVWPAYKMDVIVPSPDKRFDLVVLRGDATAFDSFSYRVYVFPNSRTPKDIVHGARVWLTPLWRLRNSLAYSGYPLPELRWTGLNTFEIDINDAYVEKFYFTPVHEFPTQKTVVKAAIEIGKSNAANVLP